MPRSEPRDAVTVPGAPRIPGLVFRAFRGERDFPAMLAVRRGSLAHDRIDPHSPRERLPSPDDLARAGFAPGTPDMLFIEADARVIGYNRVSWWPEQDGQAVFLHLGYLLPEWRGRGIGAAMFAWAEARCRALAAERMATGPAAGMRPVYATNASTTECEATRLIERAGYAVVRRLADMRLERDGAAPDVTLPAGIEPRPVHPEQYPAIYDAMADAWAGMWGVLPPGEDDYHEFLQENVAIPHFEPSLWHIAWDGERVVGLVLGELRDAVGVVAQVATRRAYRRRGIARALLLRALAALEVRRPTQIRVYTDADDGQGAKALYERAGFRTLKEHRLYRKPMERGPE